MSNQPTPPKRGTPAYDAQTKVLVADAYRMIGRPVPAASR